MKTLSGRRAVVLGLGRSGRSSARFLDTRGARVTAADERPAAELVGLGELPETVHLHVGEPFPALDSFDLVVPSPGVPASRWAGHEERVQGDVELAGDALGVPIVAVTGTNGKTTTTLLVEAMLRAAGRRAEAAGNLGRPALELVGRPLDLAVLEVSSFQLEAVRGFRPRVAVVLNLAPDHLDRHGSFEAYRAAKARLLESLGPDDDVVLLGDDPAVAGLAPACPARRWLFSLREPVERGAWWEPGALVVRDDPERVRLPWPPDTSPTNVAPENAMAAVLACHALGADPQKAASALLTFEPPAHRCERVAETQGVVWINDSKATNPAAAIHALEGTSRTVVWIAGGRNKGVSLESLAEVAVRRTRAAVLLGEAAPALEAALAGRIPTRRVESLEEAVRQARALAQAGDAVLLSPACSSFDQFGSFEERGDCFRAAVAELARREAVS